VAPPGTKGPRVTIEIAQLFQSLNCKRDKDGWGPVIGQGKNPDPFRTRKLSPARTASSGVGNHPRKPCAGPLFAPNCVNFQILSTVKLVLPPFLPILTRLCAIATAVAISSILFNFFEFTLLYSLFSLFPL
jgi:hypothetical protein